ncbi:MAG: rod shape-determining protein MreC [Bdellovibrionales bacterium]|jgi:rod shape-determining protein MreC
MSVRHSSSRRFSAAAVLSWRGFFQRFSFVLFVGLAAFLLILTRTQPEAISSLRTHTLDIVAPLLDVLARPALIIEDARVSLRSIVSLRAENKRLYEENRHLIEWQNAVVTLEKENRELRALLKFKTEPRQTYVSARVIADTGGAHARGLIITAGKSDGVREGMAAMTGEGLIGRVIEVGAWSSRVWLISDLNSRIPVMIAETGDRAILAGDNTPQPKLLFLARDASVSGGARVVTSGHGGIFPPNLPIGVLRETEHGTFDVIPAADLGRVTYVRLVDFSLEGGALNPIENKLRAEGKKK